MKKEASGVPVRVETATACAHGLASSAWAFVRPDGVTGRRWFLIGDPQTSFERFARYLHAAGLLGDDGYLARGVGLVSMGDHFDYAGEDAVVAAEGVAILRWLAEHAPDQVVILAGNHDLARVAELAAVSDARFAEARAAARDTAVSDEDFAERFTDMPVRGLVSRDYSGFSVAQRALVKALLLGRRMVLAASATTREGAPLLLTHAGVTTRELAALRSAEERDPEVIADRLNHRLGRALDTVASDWHAGGGAPLDLAPLYLAGNAAEEGGGMLYHRPAHPQETRSDAAWSWGEGRARRFDPRTLPEGLAQACGHTGHARCLKELGSWVAEDARDPSPGQARTLTRRGDDVRYELGIRPAAAGAATLYMLDPEMTKGPASVAVMEVAAVEPIKPSPAGSGTTRSPRARACRRRAFA